MTLRLKNRWLLIASLAVGMLAFGLYRRSQTSSRFPPPQSFRILETVIEHVRNDYLEEVDPRRTMEGAYQGLAAALDPLSSYLDKAAVAKYASPRRTALNDVGAVVTKRPSAFPLVAGVVEGSPAEKAGIQPGDYLSALDGRSTVGWTLSEIRWYLKDEARTPVKIRLIRENDTREVAVERAPLYARPLSWTAEKGTAGIVKVNHLHPGAAAEFKNTVLPRLAASAGPLILDLRDCHEGEAAEAAAFINLFLQAAAIGAFEKKGGFREAVACPETPVAPDLFLVVWTNAATLGPAELVAGALRELREAKVVGVPTFGLVAKQDLFKLDEGDALLLTTSAFVLPSGEKLLGKGVTPDEVVEAGGREAKPYLEKSLRSGTAR
ncbi:MAG: PDZ domain-containing protein [Candidatus Aminicenantes bacterium]|nr:PDZ domain-containing protein [Candidatus Aminicenantes bacterium]